jgi:hypothetical protein
VNKLAESLVTEWLKKYLLKDEDDPAARATEVAGYLSKHKDRLSHGRPITLGTIKDVLKIKHVLDLKTDPPLRELISELWAEVEWFVETTGTSKFFENAYGVGFRRAFQVQQIGFQFPFPIPQPAPPQAPAPQPTPPQTPSPSPQLPPQQAPSQ